MKFFEKMLDEKRIIMYYAEDFLRVTNELVAAVNWPKGVDMLSFSFKQFTPPGGCVRHELKNDYVIRYLFGGKTSELKPLGKPLKNSPISARAPRNAAEALAVTNETLCRDSAQKRRKSGPAYFKERKRYLDMIRKGQVKSVLLFKNGRNVGIASLADVPRLEGGKSSTFTWLWIDKRLPKGEYEDAMYKATKWAKDNAQPHMASANFDGNKESQKGDSRFGLRPCRIFFARKK